MMAAINQNNAELPLELFLNFKLALRINVYFSFQIVKLEYWSWSTITLLHILDMKDSGSSSRTVCDYLPQREFKGQSNVAAATDYSRCGLIQQNRRNKA